MTKWDTLAALFSLCILVAMAFACCSCTNATDDCERVRSAINTKAALCDAGFEVRGDCDAANYVDGDIDACIKAVETAACDDLRVVVRMNCLGLFGRAGL